MKTQKPCWVLAPHFHPGLAARGDMPRSNQRQLFQAIAEKSHDNICGRRHRCTELLVPLCPLYEAAAAVAHRRRHFEQRATAAQAGDTVLIRQGSYREQLQLHTIRALPQPDHLPQSSRRSGDPHREFFPVCHSLGAGGVHHHQGFRVRT